MNPMKPRRARIGVESLEGRKLTALFDAFLEIEAFDVASPSRPAEVQVRRTESAAGQRPVRRGRGRPRPVADGGPFIHSYKQLCNFENRRNRSAECRGYRNPLTASFNCAHGHDGSGHTGHGILASPARSAADGRTSADDS
jgi:hypothetical protein